MRDEGRAREKVQHIYEYGSYVSFSGFFAGSC